MLACDRVITVVHYDGENYVPTVLEGVSVYQKVEHTVSDRGRVAELVAEIRIPQNVLPWNLPKAGDFVVFDRAEGISSRQDMNQYGYALVVGVGDNRRGGLPHIKLTCR